MKRKTPCKITVFFNDDPNSRGIKGKSGDTLMVSDGKDVIRSYSWVNRRLTDKRSSSFLYKMGWQKITDKTLGRWEEIE